MRKSMKYVEVYTERQLCAKVKRANVNCVTAVCVILKYFIYFQHHQ